jgi:hypothetical protein
MNEHTVNAALTLDRSCLHWEVQLTLEEMRAFADKCSYYNDLTYGGFHQLVDAIDALIPRIQFLGNNPNNGKPCHHYIIGNQHSRVLYVEIRKPLTPRKLDYGDIESRLWALAREAGAEECKAVVDDAHTFLYRMFWD